jgi:phospholipase/lecithinase/hemolysin
MLRTLSVGVLFSLVCLSATAAPANLDRVYAFGDSYTDSGAGYGATRIMVAHGVSGAVAKPGALYWQQRWSNGPVTVEVMAKALGLPLTDYAIGGAKSGDENYNAWMNKAWPTGTLAQVADYLASQPKGQVDPNGLYFIFASANDFFAHEDFDESTPLADDTSHSRACRPGDCRSGAG